VVVADSSEGVAFEQNVELVRNPSSTIRIDHIDCRGKDITEKYVYALSSIDTLFVVVCGDDDFLVYENALRCADFLRTHQDYSHAHGRIITFWEQPSVKSPVQRIQEYRQIRNDGDPGDRIEKHFLEYHNNFYSVHRTAPLLANIIEVNSLCVGRGLKERALAALDICQGKRMMLDCLFMLRQKGMTGLDENGNRTFLDNPSDDNYFQKIGFGYSEYLRLIDRHLSDAYGIEEEDKARIIDAIGEDYEKWKKIRSAPIKCRRGILNRLRRGLGKTRLRLHHYKTLYSIVRSDINHYKQAIESMRRFYALRGNADV